MSSEDTTLLGDIDILSGFPFASENFTGDIATPLIRIRDLLSGEIQTYYRGAFDKAYLVKQGDILVGMDGDFSVVRWKGVPALLNQRICKISSTSNELDNQFLYWWLKPHIEEIHKKTPQTTVRHLSIHDIYHIPAPETSKDEQAAAAWILDTIDAAIEKSEALIAKLNQVRAGMLHDLLTCGVDESEKLRRENWHVVCLGALAEIASGVTLGRMVDGADSVELPYLRVANVQDGFIDISDVKTVRIFQSELQRYALAAGDVLMNEGGDFDKLGRGAVWDGRISPCLHQNHVFRVRCGSRLLPDFLALYSGSPAGKRFFVQSSKQTTNLASINSTQLKAFPVLLPDITEQAMIVEQIHEVDSLIGKETAGREKLQTIKSGLSTDLLTGQVRIPPELELP